MEKGLEEIAEK
jgi:hypothetical protein